MKHWQYYSGILCGEANKQVIVIEQTDAESWNVSWFYQTEWFLYFTLSLQYTNYQSDFADIRE